MHKIYIFILSSHILNLQSTDQTSPIFIHHKSIVSQAGIQIKFPDNASHSIDATYIPQQVVHIKNALTKLPLARHTYANGIQHLKCIISTKSPQKKADRKTLELLVRKEPLGKAMAQLIGKDSLLKGHETTIRLYRKVSIDAVSTNRSCWKPILTLPETADTEKLMESIRVSADGRIHVG